MKEKEIIVQGKSSGRNNIQALVEDQGRNKDQKLRILVVGTSDKECQKVTSLLPPDSYQVTTTLVERTGGVVLGDEAADVHIICLPENFHAIRDTDDYSFPTSTTPLMYTTEDTSDKTRLWAFRHGASDLLVFPFNTIELQIRIEHLHSGDRKRFDQFLNEEILLAFLSILMENNVSMIEPVLEPDSPFGHFYPEVARVFGRTPLDSLFLEKLAGESVLSRQVANRIRICPVCADTAINYRDACPHCQSLAIAETEIIHHFSCGHMGPIDTFRTGAELVCPKCENVLRHIGLDYEKPSQYYSCRDCDTLFSEPRIEAQCLRCGFTTEPDKLIAQEIYRYQTTPNAQQAISEKRISGLNLASILRSSQSGLYSKQFLEHEALREIFRSQRTGNPFCMMLIRIDDFDHIRLEHGAQTAEYLTTIFTSISNDLRVLDSTCVWDTDKLAVILPETSEEGGKIVAQRIHDNVKDLEFLYSIHEPGITVSLIQWQEKYKDHAEMFQEMQREIND